MKDYDVKELFEQLAKLDKEISIIENKKKNDFFDNIDIKDKEGNIELPLVATNNSSDYEKLKHEKRYIQMQIKQLLKQSENINCYVLEYVYALRKQGFSEKAVYDEKEKRILELKTSITEKINSLKQKFAMIENDPKTYLRFKEYECCNYSSVKDKKVVSELKSMDKELVKRQKMRERILLQIRKISKQSEAKEKKLIAKINE